jgi:hypothetical protein
MKKREIIAVIISSVSLLSFTACVDEKNQQDFRQEQVDEQVAKIMPIKGTYNGTITSAQDNASLGSISLTLTPDTDLQSSADNLSSEQHAVVRGVVSYSGLNAANVTFDQGFYDPSSGLFQVSISITDAEMTPITYQMDLSGNISGDSFTGTIEVEGYPGYGGNLTLNKNTPAQALTANKNLSAARAKLLVSEATDKFVGNYQSSALKDQTNNEFTMTIESRDTSPQQQFLDIFLPVRSAQAHLYFGSSDVGGIAFSRFYPNITIDDQTNTLDGYTTVTDTGNNSYQENLHCQRVMNGMIAAGWNCKITGGSGAVTTVSTTPESAN